jgi:hypothetical protein
MRSTEIPGANPNTVWPDPKKWDMTKKWSKDSTLQQVAEEMQLTDTAKKALSAELEEFRIEKFPDGFPNHLSGNVMKQNHVQSALKPLVERWARSFNIRVDSPLLMKMFYDLVKGKMYQTTKKNTKPATPKCATTARSQSSVVTSRRPAPAASSPSPIATPSRTLDFQEPARPRMLTYEERNVLFAIYGQPSENNPGVFLFGIADLQASGSSAISLANCSEERLKTLMKERHGVEVPGLTLDLKHSPQSNFQGVLASPATPFQMLATLAFNEREMPISFRIATSKRVRSPSVERESVKRRQLCSHDVPIRSVEPVDTDMPDVSADDVDSQVEASDQQSLPSKEKSPDLIIYDQNGVTNSTTSTNVLKAAAAIVAKDVESGVVGAEGETAAIAELIDQANDEVPTFEDWEAHAFGEDDPTSPEARAAGLQSLTDSLRYCEHMDKEHWATTCRLFKRSDVRDTANFVLWASESVYSIHYQAMAVCWMLQQVPVTFGGFVADQQGLGKTTEALIFCYCVAFLAWNQNHRIQHPDRHLPDSALPGSTCKVSSSLPLPCVCEPDCPQFLAKWHPEGAQVLIVPPATIQNWQGEFNKTFDANHRSPAKLVLVHGHKDLKPQRLKNVEYYAKSIQTDHLGDTPDSAPTHVILTAQKSFMSQVHVPLSHPQRNRYGKAVATGGKHYFFSNIIIDEAHENRNEKTNQMFTTILPRHVGHSYGTSLFLLSGTPFEKGTEDLVPYINWFEAAWSTSAEFLYTAADGGAISAHAHHVRERCTAQNFLALQENLNLLYTTSAADDSEFKARKEELKNKVADTLSKMMLRRTSLTRFLGLEPILARPPIERIDVPLEPQGKYVKLIQDLENDVTSAVRRLYQSQVREWRLAGSKPKHKPAIPMAAYKSQLWERRPAFVFPHLWEMKEANLFPDGWSGTTLSATGVLKGTDTLIREHAAALLESSGRMQYIVQTVQTMGADWKEQRDLVKARKAIARPDARRPKFVIASMQPIVAACVYECLRHAFPKKDIRFINSDMSQTERQNTQHAFQEDRKVDASGRLMEDRMFVQSPTIIVGTIGILGTGINLQRAATLLLTEPQFTSTATSQAEGRCHRFGQIETVRVHKLTSSTIKCDRDLTNRIHVRSSLAEMLQLEKQAGEGKKGKAVIEISSDDDSDEPGLA